MSRASRSIKAGLQRLNETLADAYRPMMHALWMTMTTGRREWAERYADEELRYNRLLGSDDVRALLTGLEQSEDRLDPTVRRQLEMLRAESLEHLVDEAAEARISDLWNSLHYRISTFRAEIDGSKLTENEVLTILATSRSGQARQRVWEAFMALGERTADELIPLVKARNAIARARGFSDYFEMKLALAGVGVNELAAMIAELRTGLDGAYVRLKDEIDRSVAVAFGIPHTALRPWHYEHPHFQSQGFSQRSYAWNPSELLPRLQQWLRERRLGSADYFDTADLLARPGKSQANCCLNIDRGFDVRLLGSLSTDIRGLGKLLHETGHAVYEQQLDPRLPFLLRQPAHTFLSEGAAILFEGLAWEPDWLQACGIDYAYRSSHSSMLDERRRQRLLNLYWIITLVRFERELYRDPDQALNRLWWDIVEDTQRLRRPAEWDKPYWAAKAHLSTLPVYYYNYLYGEIAASQLRHMLALQFGEWTHPDALVHLRDTLFRPGASAAWQSLLKHCTTCRLEAVFLIDDLC